MGEFLHTSVYIAPADKQENKRTVSSHTLVTWSD